MISIHAPLTGSDQLLQISNISRYISIHAPLTGSDLRANVDPGQLRPISIHAPLTGSDACLLIDCKIQVRFQSTLPLRGATAAEIKQNGGNRYFNPRSPYGERLERFPGQPKPARFQSTLPLRGATNFCEKAKIESVFQSTLPLRGATGVLSFLDISGVNFNPRSPYGERRCFFFDVVITNRFQSTLPLRGATSTLHQLDGCGVDFNPRSPYGERPEVVPLWRDSEHFNPRSPYGERPSEHRNKDQDTEFQSTLPLRGATASFNSPVTFSQISIHAPLTGSDPGRSRRRGRR